MFYYVKVGYGKVLWNLHCKSIFLEYTPDMIIGKETSVKL